MADHPVEDSHSGLGEHSEIHTGVNDAVEVQPPTEGMIPMAVTPAQMRFILELRQELTQTRVPNGHGRPVRNVVSTAGAVAYCFFWVSCTREEWDKIIADYPDELLGNYQEGTEERAQVDGEY
ncbi:hypothetical protein E4U30_005466 [Claviceps sp. LM220 group G6]|nr:hypothetical protein E4U30_005466 [Claviceps sp. LM220 group G6]KAG6109675.1 hypothetical protein E4U14_003127 [Claviceps sp. LM454 group G7]